MKVKIAIVLSLLQFLLLSKIVYSLPCILRDYQHGTVCVCNSTYCDTLETNHPNDVNEFILVSSSKGGLRFSATNGKFNEKYSMKIEDYKRKTTSNDDVVPEVILLRNKRFFDLIENLFNNKNSKVLQVEIQIDRNIKYQSIVGFGGAFTGAVSYNLDKVSDELKNHIYKAYYSKTIGIGYNILRMPIGGCDFDLEPWAYNESPRNDINLSNFTKLDQRDEKKIEQIKTLMKISNNFDIKFLGSAWSPPVWMKNNNEWSGASHLKEEYYQTWADYHIKFLELMSAKNMSFWGITTGNEPLNGVIGWLFVKFMSLGWTAKNQGKWVKENLGPALKNSPFKNVKLLGNDDQRYTYPLWFKQMNEASTNSTNYLDGLAVHWYWDNVFSPTLLDQVHEMFPEKIILNTESCTGDKPFETHGPELGSWERAEKYIHSYIEDLQHWVNGWIDWNLILDEQGGPNYVQNYVDSPIIINATSGHEFYKQPIFYGIGHFSKYLEPNSIRIETKSSNIKIETVAFQRPNGSIILIIYNSLNIAIDLTISDTLRDNIVLNIPPRSVHTFAYN